MEFNPDIKISELAQMIGYAPDGQYFSKAFKKIVEMTPTEYRDKIIEEHNKKTVME